MDLFLFCNFFLIFTAAHLQQAPSSGISPQVFNSWLQQQQQQQQPISPSVSQQHRLRALEAERERLKSRQREIQQVTYSFSQ